MKQNQDRRGRKQEVETTPHHEHRLEEAEKFRKNKAQQPRVKEEYYFWEAPKTAIEFEKKGRKLKRIQITENGGTSIWIGWEKKLKKDRPGFVDKIKKQGLLREN